MTGFLIGTAIIIGGVGYIHYLHLKKMQARYKEAMDILNKAYLNAVEEN